MTLGVLHISPARSPSSRHSLPFSRQTPSRSPSSRRHAAEEVRHAARGGKRDWRRGPAEAEEAEGTAGKTTGHVERRLEGGGSAPGGCHHRPAEQDQRQ